MSGQIETEAELQERSRRRHRCELVDGRVVDLPLAGARHSVVNVRLTQLLATHVRSHSSGYVFGPNTGFRLPNGNVRDPDCAVVSSSRLSDTGLTNDFCPVAPDLAVEVLANPEQPHDLLARVGDYLQGGSRMVWLIDPDERTVTVYRSVSDVTTVSAAEVLDGGEAVPGFSCRPRDFM